MEASERMPIPHTDLEFLMRSQFVRSVPEYLKKDVIAAMTRRKLAAGERLLAQGQSADSLYLIQEGSCIVSFEKNGESHAISRLKRGDVVGAMAVLTGEQQISNVDAETDTTAWSIPREKFNEICGECAGVREFLSEIVTERLCSQRITAERTIGRYTIYEIIAEGGWSIVYKGIHSFLNLPVAIKMLKHNMALDSEFFQQFENEPRVIANLNHENIVRVYDIEYIYGTIFIIMEFLEGLTVKHILETTPRLPISRIAHILMQVCSGLHYAHEKGIIHQDVKPGNIFVEKNDKVKLVDFGLACPTGVCSDELPGTPFYMAPEQIEGDPVDPRTDIYCLGITAYEMATGQRPFSDDVCEVLKSQLMDSTPDPRKINPNVPDELADFILKATRKDPAARYGDIPQVIQELAPLAERLGIGIAPEIRPKRKMMSLLMFYGSEYELELNRLLETFGRQVEELGGKMRVTAVEDI